MRRVILPVLVVVVLLAALSACSATMGSAAPPTGFAFYPRESSRPSFAITDASEIARIAREKGNVSVIVEIADSETKTASVQEKPRKARKAREKALSQARSKLNSEKAPALGITGAAVSEQAEDIEIIHEMDTSAGFTAVVTAEAVEALAETPGVTVRLDPVLKFALAESVPKVDANDVWNLSVNGTSLRGEGQAVCVIDSGIDYDHPAFAGRILDGRCFLASGCPGEQNDTSDNNGHGTHVAGIVAANGSVVGVAPAANLVIVKACDINGDCYLGAMTAGVDWCVNVSQQYNISAITISISDMGHYDSLDSCPYDPNFESAADAAAELGIVLTIASGNGGGSTGIGYPSCIPSATSVGATDDGDSIPSFTERGNLLDMLAPGVNIISTTRGGGTTSMSGTSMATPMAAGAVAILRQNELLNGRTVNNGYLENLMRNGTGVFVEQWPRLNVLHSVLKSNSNITINESASLMHNENALLDFKDSVDLSDVAKCVVMSRNSVFVNSTKCPQYNRNATLEIRNIALNGAIPLRDGVLCANCTAISYANGTLRFDVTGFSNYSAGINSELYVWDITDNETRLQGQPITVFANYSNRSNGALAAGTCELRTNGSWSVMAAGTLYTGNITGSSVGALEYEVRCNSTTFEALNASGQATVGLDTSFPSVSLVAPANGTEINSSSLVRFTFNATDNSVLRNCSLLVDGATLADLQSPQKNVNSTLNATLTDGTHSWSVVCADIAGNTNHSANRSVSLLVNNLPPDLVTPISNLTLPEDTNLTISISWHFDDSNGDELLLSAQPQSGLSVTIDNATGNATLVPGANVTGDRTVTFIASDGQNSTSSNVVVVSVTNVNDAPFRDGTIPSRTWDEGEDRTSAFDLDDYFDDIDNSTLLYSHNGTNNISVIIDPDRHNVTFHPLNNFTGVEYVTFLASDGQYNTTSNTVQLTVQNATNSSGGAGGGGGTDTCLNDCSVVGNQSCAGVTSYYSCGYHDSDSCLDLVPLNCPIGTRCYTSGCEERCEPSWQCTGWSGCDDGWQRRECQDLYSCGKDDEMPMVQQRCDGPAAPQMLKAEETVPESETPAEAPAAETFDVEEAGSCGDGNCSLAEFCLKDCGYSKLVAPLMMLGAVLLAGVAMRKKKASGALPPSQNDNKV